MSVRFKITLVIYWTFGLFLQSVLLFLEIFISEDVRWKFIRNFQGWFMIQFSMFFLLSSVFDWWPVHHRALLFLLLSATFIFYNRFKYLSTTFLFIFFRKHCRKCFAFMTCTSSDASFYVVSFWKAVLSSDSLYIIIHNFTFVNNFFSLFCSLSKPPEKCTWWREKRTAKSIAYQRKHLMVRES